MNVAKPILPKEYEELRRELYSARDGRECGRFEVCLDKDPTLQPKNLNAKLQEVQSYKNRVVVILNKAVRSEAYWKTALAKVKAKFDACTYRASATDEVKAGKSQDIRESLSKSVASAMIVAELFEGKGAYEDHMAGIVANHADANAFLVEVQNIYDNLHSTDQNLSRQLKSVIVNTRLYGEMGDDAPAENDQRVRIGGQE
jgi:hypothetical protein